MPTIIRGTNARVERKLLVAATPEIPDTILFSQDYTTMATGSPIGWHNYRATDAFLQTAPPVTTNFDVHGGVLNIDVKKESAPVSGSTATENIYSGAFAATFNYGSAWPPITASGRAGKLNVFTVPFRIEFRVKRTGFLGLWPAFWLMQTNRLTTEGIWELDFIENPLTVAHPSTHAQFGHHLWVSGKSQTPNRNNGQYLSGVSDMETNWHVCRLDVLMDGPEHYIREDAAGSPWQLIGKGKALFGGTATGGFVNPDTTGTTNVTTGDNFVLQTPTPEFGLLLDSTLQNAAFTSTTAAWPVGTVKSMQLSYLKVFIPGEW